MRVAHALGAVVAMPVALPRILPRMLPGALDPQPGPARELLRRELAKAQYDNGASLVDRVVDWVSRRWHELNDRADSGASHLSTAVTVVLALLVVALLAYVLPRVRRERRSADVGAVLEDELATAQDYRERAAAALREGRHEAAVVDGFRAIARGMTDRTLLSGAYGQTAHEIGLALSSAFAAYADRLAGAADVFDAVRYGGAPATLAQAESMLALDADLSGARPDLGAAPAPLGQPVLR